MMAAGGSQLKNIYEDDGIYYWQFHVDWKNPANTKASGPEKIEVAPYHYLCNGQLTNCVPQPGTERKLDAQGDKLMQRLVYRRIGRRESIVAQHSVNTESGGGGVRWYEFRLDGKRIPRLYQQGTYAPDGFYRWMGSIGMDRQGNIGVGYSFGGTPHFVGQRFAARLAKDPKGQLTLQEIGPGERRGITDYRKPSGRLHYARDGSGGRLHVLVCGGLLENRSKQLFDQDRSVPDSGLCRKVVNRAEDVLRVLPPDSLDRALRSKSRAAAVSIPDSDSLGHVENEDLAVADLAGPCGSAQGLDHFVRTLRRNHHLQLHFW